MRGSKIKSIQSLQSLIRSLEIEDAIICPGSRNLPIVNSLAHDTELHCTSVIDEREAGYIALGMAKASNKPVVLNCTSGTAVLNFSPAIAEAYHQGIGLLVITADRPLEMIDKGENQTINQTNIYQNYIRYSLELSNYDRISDSQANTIHQELQYGPVHINVHIEEPLNEFTEYKLEKFELKREVLSTPIGLDIDFNKYNKAILYVSDTMFTEKDLEILRRINTSNKCILVSENQSNTNSILFEKCLDYSTEEHRPNLLITMGGKMISKKARECFKSLRNLKHVDFSKHKRNWNLSNDYTCIQSSIIDFIELMLDKLIPNIEYSQSWLALNSKAIEYHDSFMKNKPFNEFAVTQYIINNLSNDSVVYWGNSSVIRYANWSIQNPKIINLANRGTSGIDGVLSSAIGYASKYPNKDVYCILGDVSMMYEANTLKNIHLAPNLKIIIFNNKGGQIFNHIHYLEGKSKKILETNTQYDFSKMSQMFDIQYIKCTKLNSMAKCFEESKKSVTNTILEIAFDNDKSVWRSYWE